ncbi:MAG: outer membrane beta-barrel family protein, partial [Muribaculaceae bacterium]|nr:outer membrane beta-barrel family protein [Muribaculaceae bacterium]
DLDSDKKYVMDVKLKKEYSHGWILNAEGGYGSHDRYLGHLFGLNYTTHSRFSIFGNVNNLGSDQSPGGDNSYGFMDKATNVGSGRSELINGGFDYNIDKNKKSFRGNAYVSYKENYLTSTTSVVNFLPQNNNYSYSRSNSKTSNINVSTWHRLSNFSDYIRWSASPSYSYSNSDGSSADAQAMYNSELTGEQWMGLLNRLMAGDVTPEMRDSLINQSLRASGSTSVNHNANAEAWADIKFHGSPDWLSTHVKANYAHSHSTSHNRYLINYGNEAVPGLGQRQRTAGHPNRNYSIAADVNYNYVFSSKTRMDIKYSFDDHWHEQTSNLYLAQIQADATGRFDLLALEQIKETLDAHNSYSSHDHTTTHDITPNFNHKFKLSDCNASLNVTLPVQILTKRLHYIRGSVDVDPRHTWCLVNRGSINLNLNKSNNKAYDTYSASYSLTMSAPDLMRMIDIVDDADPLNIYIGNPSLRSSLTHNMSLYYSHFAKKSQTQVSGNFGGSYQQRDVSSGYSLDPTTGVRRYKAYNVDGNWSLFFSGQFNSTYGKSQQWHVSVIAFGSYYNYTNLISLGTGEPQPSDARSLSVNLMSEASYSAHGINASAGISALWTRSSNSGMYGSTPNNVGNANPYISIRAQLPAHFYAQTQLRMYNRLGMSDPALSKPQWVWIATLSYTPTKRWTISLDGFDMLRQLTQANVSVNAQGRIETYSNSLPSYFMARVQYRLSISPKKAKTP